jgi:hypothetical protein
LTATVVPGQDRAVTAFPGTALLTFDKDLIVAVGVMFTAIVGLWNLAYNFSHNRRASYVASVTATRLKWIGEVRDHLARYVALIYGAAVAPPSDPTERLKLFSEIAHHRMLLRLQLAPEAAKSDKIFEEQIEAAFHEANAATLGGQAETRLDGLVKAGQAFLWTEWRKVKDEAIFGDPYDTLPRRLERWVKRIEQ